MAIPSEIRQQLKHIAEERKRPFDEIFRYYAMERFLYRLGVSRYAKQFFLKGGLMLRVWNSTDHRATMDIDLLGRISNKPETLRRVITEIAAVQVPEDAIVFHTEKLLLKPIQTAGDYQGINANFSAQLSTIKISILMDIGFNDIAVPAPQKIKYPTLLSMPAPQIFGYTPECVMAEKLESIVKLGLINTRMKDFYDVWTFIQKKELHPEKSKLAIREVFTNRETKLQRPIAFTKAFYESPQTIKRWNNFLSAMGKKPISFKEVISEISDFIVPLLRG